MLAVTGGAGFIGSNLARKLLETEDRVLVVDNFSSGKFSNIRDLFQQQRIEIIRQDIAEMGTDALRDVECVFHLAADPSVKDSSVRTREVFRSNIQGTFRVLEACRKNDSGIVFASTSAVYGMQEKFPIAEDSELRPISNYGASKAAGEMMVRSYSHTYGIDAVILRYANIFGPPSDKGVMHDFVRKLQKNPNELEILGNGLQQKSYLWVGDAVEATILAWKKTSGLGVFNVGSEEWLTVNEIADIISSEMGLKPDYIYTGGEERSGDAVGGWKGDVPKFLLDVSRLKSLGWEPAVPVREGIRRYVSYLLGTDA